MLRISALLLSFIALLLSSCSKHKDIYYHIDKNIPKEVYKTWDSLYQGSPRPNAHMIIYPMRDTAYSISFIYFGFKRELIADKHGNIIEERLMDELPPSMLPKPVLDSMEVRYPGVRLEAARRVIIRDTCSYQILIGNGISKKNYARWFCIAIMPDGSFIGKEEILTAIGEDIELLRQMNSAIEYRGYGRATRRNDPQVRQDP